MASYNPNPHPSVPPPTDPYNPSSSFLTIPQDIPSNPFYLTIQDALTVLRLLPLLPNVVLPLPRPSTSTPLSELYPTPSNLRDVILHTILLTSQIILIASVPPALLALFAVPGVVHAVFYASFALITGGITWLLNRRPQYKKSLVGRPQGRECVNVTGDKRGENTLAPSKPHASRQHLQPRDHRHPQSNKGPPPRYPRVHHPARPQLHHARDPRRPRPTPRSPLLTRHNQSRADRALTRRAHRSRDTRLAVQRTRRRDHGETGGVHIRERGPGAAEPAAARAGMAEADSIRRARAEDDPQERGATGPRARGALRQHERYGFEPGRVAVYVGAGCDGALGCHGEVCCAAVLPGQAPGAWQWG
ncbi:uncharacterized protein DSM5745_02090 [Aspergillus mulundensis]|uniref:Uncharacterized protein n=1 Tax=Aspergillus mulundensis TaxID=1810919 RepID=A0A3D8SVK1_9EURO|nr:hypothetical protein DSM5745_02090 [Aspergillus mulundensis]RDW90315.1 hypothetical protein DSM5745_02090 [Aspergillus mulundensis]